MLKRHLKMDPTQDPFFKNPAYTELIRTKLSMATGWVPSFNDMYLTWGRKPLFYQDLLAIYNPSDYATKHPEQIAQSNGKPLYINWGCANGICPQFCADPNNRDFQTHWIENVKSAMKVNINGVDYEYDGIFIDDVNLQPCTTLGDGKIQLPDNFTASDWAWAVAGFVKNIRQALPGKTIVHNSVWFNGADRFPNVVQVRAADWINCERGFTDPNLNATTLLQQLQYYDFVHSMSRNLISEELNGNLNAFPNSLEFAVGCFLLVYTNDDMFSVTGMTPDQWAANPILDIDLGSPVTSMIFTDNTVQRMFSRGTVTVDLMSKTAEISTF